MVNSISMDHDMTGCLTIVWHFDSQPPNSHFTLHHTINDQSKGGDDKHVTAIYPFTKSCKVKDKISGEMVQKEFTIFVKIKTNIRIY
jgi:hypothetical protein